MVAATFLNESFETPDGDFATLVSGNEPFVLTDGSTATFQIYNLPQTAVFEVGTRSSVLSANAEPFVLADLQTLDVSIDGAPAVTITFNTVDFVDITQASASEVAGEILSQIGGGAFASTDAGKVRVGSLTKGSSSLVNVSGGTAAAALGFPAGVAGVDNFASMAAATAAEVAAVMGPQLSGVSVTAVGLAVEVQADQASADVCLRAVGGSAATALSFPTGLVCGLHNPGYAADWAVTSVATYWDFVEFAAGLQFPAGVERFTLGWSSAEDDLQDLSNVVTASFAGSLFETFTWYLDLDGLAPAVAAVFNTSAPLSATAYDAFDQGWPGIPGCENDIYSFSPGDVSLALFNGSQSSEVFTLGWPAQYDSTALSGLVMWSPGQGGGAETFEPYTSIHTEIEVILAVVGDSYGISINGLSAVTVAATPDPSLLATQLAAGISNLPTSVSAVAVGPRIQVTNTGTQIAPFEVGVSGTVLTNMIKVYDGPTDPALNWTGESQNRFC